jgi:hypothetical protein
MKRVLPFSADAAEASACQSRRPAAIAASPHQFLIMLMIASISAAEK